MISNFTDLVVWKKSHSLVLEIYRIVREFPDSEFYALTNQLKRAAVSITSNIAEGFSRRGYKEKVQFYYLSLGSLTEIQNELLIAKDLQYIKSHAYDSLFLKTIEVSKLLNGLIKSIKDKNR